MKVIVVTDAELGWDCVVGVYASEEAILKSHFNQELDKPFTEYSKLENHYQGDYCFLESRLEGLQ